MGAAKARFSQAFADAEAGKIGAQYLEDTSDVKAAKERFFRFFEFALSGMLYKLSPVPGQNVLPAEIADFYIKDDPEVAAAKRQFDELYRNAAGGDLASALALTGLAEEILRILPLKKSPTSVLLTPSWTVFLM